MASHLLLAKRLFGEACEYAGRADPVSAGIAISLLQDSVEILIWALVKAKGIQVKDGAGFVSNLESLRISGIALRDVARIQELNRARIGFKHYGNLPATTEASKFRTYVEGFLRSACADHFDLDFDALSLVDLVPIPEIQARLRVAEALVVEEKFRDAIREASIARAEIFSMLNRYVPEVRREVRELDRVLGALDGIRDFQGFTYITQYLVMLREATLVALLRLPLDDYAFLNSTLYGAIQTGDKKWQTTDMVGRVPNEGICRRQIACLVNICIAVHAVVEPK